jgi:GT2 family glycosyltransferase
MKIGFVFTNYNNSSFSREAVRSIVANRGSENFQLVIVDNASESGEVDDLRRLKEEFPSVHLILNRDNVGYFRGLNVGISFLRERYADIDHLVIGNNDLVFPPTFADALCGARDLFGKYAVICPDLLTLDGVHQNPHVVADIGKMRELIYDLYFSSYALALAIGFVARVTRRVTERKDYGQHQVARTIYQGYGACYILGPLFFEHFKDLWAPTFLMGEEFFLSKQLRDKGQELYYEPTILVRHHDHASIGNVPGKKMWRISRDSHRVYRKYVKVFR